MQRHFAPKPTPDISIEWSSYVRRPFSWTLGTPPTEFFNYDSEDLVARGFAGDNPVYVTEISSQVVFRAKQEFRDTKCFPVFWEWNFGDGVRAYGQEVSHVYSIPFPQGTQVVLTVTDNKGRKWRARTPMYVMPRSETPVLIDPDTLIIPAPSE